MSTTVMWEAKAAEDRLDELVAFAVQHAAATADVYRSHDGRVLVIDPSGRGMAGVPADLVARPPHVWAFEPVPR